MTSIVDHGTTRDGLIQLRRRWPAEGDARAAVLLLHGIAEHSGRYEHVGRRLAAAGFEVIAIDHRGFGGSGGRRGHVDEFSQYLDDVEDQLHEVRKLALPTVMMAHSLGGLIAVAYCTDGRPLPDLLVVSGPALGYDMSPKERVLGALVPVLLRVAPTAEIRQRDDPSLLATDPRVGEIFHADPLRVPYPTISLGAAVKDAMDRTRTRVDRLSIPTLVFHGGDDRLVPTEASAVLEGLPGVERWVVPAARHEVHNEPAGAAVIGDVVAWIEARL